MDKNIDKKMVKTSVPIDCRIRRKKMRALIAAAGTAGHINPAISIANKIKEEEPDSKIAFIGTTRGLENDLVPRAGYELKTIDAYGLSKEFSIDNLKKW